LHAAATCANLQICKILIENNADLLAVNTDGNMPYDICDDEVCLEFIESEMAKKGVTQQAIDMKRSEAEMKMLHDLKQICLNTHNNKNNNNNNQSITFDGYLDLNAKDNNGATLVKLIFFSFFCCVLVFFHFFFLFSYILHVQMVIQVYLNFC
jgi:hypothetical protein